jgi:hypothetical protein
MKPFGGFGTTPSRKLPPHLDYSRQRLLFSLYYVAVLDWLALIYGIGCFKCKFIDIYVNFHD